MNSRSRSLIGLAAVVALALPATAAGHERSSVKSVKVHVRKADRALERVAELVRGDDAAVAAVAFARNRVETRRAQAEAALVQRRSARGGVAAQGALARQQDTAAAIYAGLLDDAAGDMQLQVAKAVAASLKGRDRALAELERLAGQLPEPARTAIARAIAALTADGEQEVETLHEALPGLPEEVRPWVELAIAQATAGLAAAVAQLEGLIPMLPEAAQGPVQAALEQVSGVIEHVTGILEGLFGDSAQGEPGTTGSPLPIPALPFPLPIPKSTIALPIPGSLG